MSYSIIIKNGTIIDGTGKTPNYQEDVGIKNNKIATIGNLQNEYADEIIDAKGFYVAPGFIDITAHSDIYWTLFQYPVQESFIRQGATTIVGGHGGASLAPFTKTEAIKVLEKWIDPSSVNINWRTFPELFSEIEKHGLGINFATFTGHENLRRNVIGNEIRPANKQEVREMASILEGTLKEGSFGFSTNLGTAHGSIATNEELVELLKICKKYNALSSHHLEDEGKNLLPSISRIIMLLRNSESRGNIAHIKALGRKAWEDFENALNMIEMARKDGVDITCDFFPYTRTGSSLSSFLPSWLLSENKEKIIEILGNEKSRTEIIEYLKALTLHYEKIIIASTARDTGSTGKSIKELGRISGLSGEEIILDLLKINGLGVSIFNDVIMPGHLETLSQKSYAMIGSDGAGYDLDKIKDKRDFAHPRSFGSFVGFLSEFVQEKSLSTWEKAIYKMSGLPAKTLGIKKRGVIVEGNYADISVFNPSRLATKSTYNNPWQYADGVEHVIINGLPVLMNGEMRKKTAGKIIKRD